MDTAIVIVINLLYQVGSVYQVFGTIQVVIIIYCLTVQDEKFDLTGPSIDELVEKENVDKLDYVGWLIDQGTDPKKVQLSIYCTQPGANPQSLLVAGQAGSSTDIQGIMGGCGLG